MELSRRELLGSVFGAAVGAACARAPRTREVEGELLGPSMKVGHALASFGAASDAELIELPVLVVGAGVSGLSAAWQLLREGRERVLVLELEPEPGGTARAGAKGGLEYPWGAHYLPCPSPDQRDLLALLEETGSVVGYGADGAPIFEEAHLVVAPKERLYIGGAWSEGLVPLVGSSAEDRRQLERFGREIAGWVDKRGADGRRAFDLPLGRSSLDPELWALDRITMDEWMRARGYDSPRLRWMVEYACRDDYGTELAYTSAWAALHYHAARTLEGERESAELLAWPSGNGFLVRHLAAKVGAERIARDVAAARVLPAPDGRRADVLALDVKTGRARRYRAERVILAVPGYLRRVLLADHPARREVFAPPYAPWLVANVHLKDRPGYRGYPECWDNVLYDSPSLGYVSATHQALIDHGRTVWTYYLPIVGADAKEARGRLMALERGPAVEGVIAELSRAHLGLAELVERVDVWRWGHGLARPEPGVLSSPLRARELEPLGAIHFAHSDLSGVGLFEEAFAHGVRAAREVARALS